MVDFSTRAGLTQLAQIGSMIQQFIHFRFGTVPLIRDEAGKQDLSKLDVDSMLIGNHPEEI